MDTQVTDKAYWEAEHTKLRLIFKEKKIVSASRRELEHYLIVLANTRRTGDQNWQADTECFATVVRHLLQIRISEELHWRSMVAAGVSALLAALSVSVAVWQAWDAHQARLALARASHTASAPASPPTQAP